MIIYYYFRESESDAVINLDTDSDAASTTDDERCKEHAGVTVAKRKPKEFTYVDSFLNSSQSTTADVPVKQPQQQHDPLIGYHDAVPSTSTAGAHNTDR